MAATIKFLAAGGLFYSPNGLHGNPAIGYRDEGTLDDLLVGEPYLQITHSPKGASEKVTVSQGFQRGAPSKDRVVLNVPIHAIVLATGTVAFTNPSSGRSYVITDILQNHQEGEGNAAQANLQVVICRGTQDAANGFELLSANEIEVETGQTDNTVLRASLDDTSVSQRTVRPGDRVVVLFQDNAGTSDIATTEYDGCVTIVMEPVVNDNEKDLLLSHRVTADEVLPVAGVCIYQAVDTRMQVVSIQESHSVAESSASTLNLVVERSQGTEGVGSGDDLLGLTGIDLKGTANTVIDGTIDTTGARDILEPGDKLIVSADIDAGGTPTVTAEYVGTVTVRLRPVTPAPVEELYVNGYFRGSEDIAATGAVMFIADQEYRVTHVSEVHTVIETGVAAPSLMLERLQGTDAVAAGDLLLAVQDVDLDATVNTKQDGTVVTASGVNILAAGDRLAFYMTDDGAADAAVAHTNLEGCVTVRLEPTGGAGPLKGGQLFQADGKSYRVTDIEATWGRAERSQSACNLVVERRQGTESEGGGDLLVGATDLDVTGTANTLNAATVVTGSSVDVLADGDRLACYFADDNGDRLNPGELDDLVVTVKLEAQSDSMSPEVVFTASDKAYEIVSVQASWATAEATLAQCNLDIVKLATTKAADGARATGIEDVIVTTGATQIDLTGTIDTVNEGTLVTAASEELLAVGDRLAIRFSDDAGSVVTPTELAGLSVTIRVVPQTMTAVSSS